MTNDNWSWVSCISRVIMLYSYRMHAFNIHQLEYAVDEENFFLKKKNILRDTTKWSYKDLSWDDFTHIREYNASEVSEWVGRLHILTSSHVYQSQRYIIRLLELMNISTKKSLNRVKPTVGTFTWFKCIEKTFRYLFLLDVYTLYIFKNRIQFNVSTKNRDS